MGTIEHLTPNPLSMQKSHARVRTFAGMDPFVGSLGIQREHRVVTEGLVLGAAHHELRGR